MATILSRKPGGSGGGGGGGGTPGGSNQQVQYNNAGAFGGATGFTYDPATGGVTINPTANVIPLLIKGSAGQTQQLVEILDSTFAYGLDIEANGSMLLAQGPGATSAGIKLVSTEASLPRVMFTAGSLPANGVFAANDIGLWYDGTNGAAKFMLKGKTADGTVVTWEIPNGTVYVAGGTDVAVADGGTGASTAAAGLANLGGIAASIVDVKGDIIAATAADTVARLAVGADETLALVPDSTQATGLKYATSGPFVGRGYKSGRYYSTIERIPGATVIPPEARVYATPFHCRKTTTFDRMGTWQTVAGAAGAVIRFGIYADDGNAYPGALVLDAGTVAATAAGSIAKEVTISQSLTRGLYWLVAVVQGAAATRPTLTHLQVSTTIGGEWASTGATFWAYTAAFYADSVSGALGTPFNTSVASSDLGIAVWMRAA